MKIRPLDCLEKDCFLSEIIGRPTYQIKPVLFNNDVKEAVRIFLQEPSFVFSKIGVEDINLIHELQAMGFNLIDTNVVLEKEVNNYKQLVGNCNIDFAVSADKDSVIKLANTSFKFSRFHLDPQIPLDVANTIKSKWVENYFLGKRGTHMVVAKSLGVVVGFLLCIKINNQLCIDLFAVDSQYRRMKVAHDMISFAMNSIPNVTLVFIGTQLANVPSINLFISMGFKLKQSKYVFHYHKF